MSLLILGPVIFFLAILLITGFYYEKKTKNHPNFTKEYFIANRTLGGVVLAMTLVATYGSVSSFVSGPGLAWNLGYGWVVFAAPQIITGFLLLGVVGKKLAYISRTINAITIIDVIDKRFNSKFLSISLALIMLIFFITMIIGQFIGGAQIFSAITKLDYSYGLLLFAVVTVLYTSGGFKAVVITDAICAVLMLTGMIALFYIIIYKAGGLENIALKLDAIELNEQGISKFFDVNANGALPFGLLFSAWILVGFGTIGLPQSLVRAITYKNTQNLHQAMIIATIICGALMIGMTLIGVLSRAIIDELPQGGTDSVIPNLIANHMHPLLAGITIIGPLAATMSTVSSLLIAATSAIVKDLSVKIKPNMDFSTNSHKLLIKFITITIGIISIILALYPQDIVVWINMFAFGGLECAFLWPIILGLYWSKMNKHGAILGVLCAFICYISLSLFKINIFNMHAIVLALCVGLLCSIIGSYIGGKNTHEVMQHFFPHKI